jgi:DNA-binding CsgD family transcriptional regulator
VTPTAGQGEAVGLLERERELERLADTIERAQAGSGELLLVEGPAGIGKTSLLRAAREIAADRGMRALTARATELEREFPFGAVRQLLEPPLRSAPPERRDELFAGGAGDAATVLGMGGTAHKPPTEPQFATLHALYWLIANLAEADPLLVVLDDAQWADPASLRLLAFLAPRLEELPVLLVVAARPEEWDARALFAPTASDAASRSIVPSPLSEAASAEMVADRYGDGVDPEFARACHATTLGNPYYLHALLDELERDGVEPAQRAADRVLSLGPRAVSQAILARLARLRPAASALARAVAILGDHVRPELAARLAGLESDEAAAAAEDVDRASILDAGELLSFAHPITRNAVYRDIGRGERARLHREAAALLGEQDAPPEQVAAQLMAVEPAADADVVATLRAAAAEASVRGATDSATAYLRRALGEPPPADRRAEVLVELGLAEWLTDVTAATEHLAQALELTRDPLRRSLIAATLSRTQFYAGLFPDAVEVARRAAEEVGDGDPEIRQGLESIILAASCVEPTLRELAEELAERVRREGIEGDGYGAKALASGLLYVDARAGIPAAEAVERAERILDGGVLLEMENGRAAFLAPVIAFIAADSELALPALEAGLDAARERGDVSAMAGDRTWSCLAHLVRGELMDAIADGEAGLAASDEYGVAVGVPWAAAWLAMALMERGDFDQAERALARADAGPQVPDNAHWHAFLDARAQLHLLKGPPRRALEDALECGRRFEAVGGRNPAFIPWRSRAALCLTELGEEPERARALAGEEVELARAWGAPRALGSTLRAQGLVLGGELATLREAVEVLDGSPARLEHARALVELGAALRRGGGRSEAREPLKAGLELARDCGGIPLVERAYEELRASGARPRKIVYTGVDALTASEGRVARLAASGMTNREIAQSLFVTVKTVEFHLGQAYRKLDISSRTELGDALGEGG